jgi:hypothetical protein
MMERWTVRTADRTVAVNQEILSELMGRHRGIDPDRLLMIPNGFDEDDFRGVERTAPAKFTLVHTGSLFRSRDPRVFREALADLAVKRRFADTTKVVLGRSMKRLRCVQASLGRVVRLVGYLPRESLRLLSTVCLLFVGERPARRMLTGNSEPRFRHSDSGDRSRATSRSFAAGRSRDRSGSARHCRRSCSSSGGRPGGPHLPPLLMKSKSSPSVAGASRPARLHSRRPG